MPEMKVHTDHRRDTRRAAVSSLEGVRRLIGGHVCRTPDEYRDLLELIDHKIRTAITLVDGSIREEFGDGQ